MKQHIISFLSTIKDEILNISKYLYENPEPSYGEFKASSYLKKILKTYNFCVTDNYLNISTAFRAEFGTGHPKICFICEYDAVPNLGHIFGYNLVSAMSIGAALGLSKVLPNISGSVIVIGCPGEVVGSSKITMTKDGAFEDIDAVLTMQPNVVTTTTVSSNASSTLQLIRKTIIPSESTNPIVNYELDSCNFLLNSLELLVKGSNNGCLLSNFAINSNIRQDEYITTQLHFLVNAPNIKNIDNLETDLKKLILIEDNILHTTSKLSIVDLPYKELLTSNILNRLLCHNLKELGIIEIEEPKCNHGALGLGSVSHTVPCVHSSIKVVREENIKYGTQAFANATISSYANEVIIKAACALAITGLDLLEKQSLLLEIKADYLNKLKINSSL